MDEITSASLGARRNEDIALDLLKFVSVTAGVGRQAAPSTGFSGAAGPKPEEHVNQLLSLYGRCLRAIEGREQEPEKAPKAQEPVQTGQRLEPELAGGRAEQPIRPPQGWMPRS